MKMTGCPEGKRRGVRMAALRRRFFFLSVSILFLIPCYWQPRIQAGDLSSHIYNAWLAQLIEDGRTPGLTIVHQTTNVFFDWMLSSLFRHFGPDAAQHISVSLAVLVFLWGAFAFLCAVSGRKPWHLLPCAAMLAYGWVFRMGLFNFYLSFGLCFWAMAVAWKMKPSRMVWAAPVLLLAYVAHALPVMWTASLLVYAALAKRARPLFRFLLTLGAVAALAVIRWAIAHTMVARWSPLQIVLATGADQLWVFDAKYGLAFLGLLGAWGLMATGLIRQYGLRKVAESVPFHLSLLSAACVLILPDAVLIPGFANVLGFIAERMSLGVAICVCALLGMARPRVGEIWALRAVALLFFGFLYADERALNRFEDHMEAALSHLPANQRVISAAEDPESRLNPLRHMIDRTCIGRCFSYGNYEPSTAQFRIRARPGNRFVTSSYADSCALQDGGYLVQARDLPLYEMEIDSEGRVFFEELRAGVRTAKTSCRILWTLFPRPAAHWEGPVIPPDGQERITSPLGSTPPARNTSM